MATFKVVRRVPRIIYDEQVLLETDDWLEAEAKVCDDLRGTHITMSKELPTIQGTHSTHHFERGRCTNEGCSSYDNGSYGSHAPCGFFGKYGEEQRERRPLIALVDEWKESHG